MSDRPPSTHKMEYNALVCLSAYAAITETTEMIQILFKNALQLGEVTSCEKSLAEAGCDRPKTV